jgi:hypothetical protein
MKMNSIPSQSKTGINDLTALIKKELSTDTVFLLLLTLGWGLFMTLIVFIASRQYGFHGDELNLIENGQHLAWGYVEYPPLAPFLAHIAFALFGLSLVGIRSFSILVVCLVFLLTALMARELGGSLRAQVVAGLAAVTAPILLFAGLLFSYETFDYLWWVVIAYFMIRLLKSDNPRWWLGIGAAIGLGAMTNYIIGVEIIALIAGVIFTPARRYLKSPWLWAGAALAVLIVSPNLVWQAQHQWIAIRFTSSIHARDMSIGRTSLLAFLPYQLLACTNIAAIALWITGFWYYARRPEGQGYRALAWMAAVPFIFFLIFQGRYYYPAPIYPMLIAAGSCQVESRLAGLSGRRLARQRSLQYGSLAVISLLLMAVTWPIAPVNSALGRVENTANSNYREEIGWRQLVQTIAGIRSSLPVSEQAGVGVLTDSYGETAAVDLYGPVYHLPAALSGINTYWLRGYGNPLTQTLIAVGFSPQTLSKIFQSCQAAGAISNRFNLPNDETRNNSVIYICRDLRYPWPQFWKYFQYFG